MEKDTGPMSEGYNLSDWLEDDDNDCEGYSNGCMCSRCEDQEAGY